MGRRSRARITLAVMALLTAFIAKAAGLQDAPAACPDDAHPTPTVLHAL